MSKYLIVRFSSFGDIAQALPAANIIRHEDPQAEIHWLTRDDFSEFVKLQKAIDHTWALDRKKGLSGLCKLLYELRKEKYTHIYDAHNNLRSFIVRWFLRFTDLNLKIAVRSKSRFKRFLLFRFGINQFEKPFMGARSFIIPLQKWFSKLPPNHPVDTLNSISIPDFLDLPIERCIALAPSAAWGLKKWPIEHWQKLIELLPHSRFLVLGGPDDHECATISEPFGDRIRNLAGKLSWAQTASLISRARLTISADTGVLHVADILGRPAVALIGPTAFGYPTLPTSKVFEVPLNCRPCTKDGRGRCKNVEFKKCMIDIQPHAVARYIQSILG